MRLDGPAVQYMLFREFGAAEGEGFSRGETYDYPILYEAEADMRGHVVLLRSPEWLSGNPDMNGTLCVCPDRQTAQLARKSGAAVVWLGDDVAFQHLYNRMQHVFVETERLDARLRTLVDTCAGMQSLIDACVEAMGYSCALIDEQYRFVCKALVRAGADTHNGNPKTTDFESGLLDSETLDSDVIDLFMGSRKYRYMRTSRNVFTIPSSGSLMMKNIFSGDRLIGSLIMEHKGNALSARFVRFLLSYLGSFVEDAYNHMGSFGMFSLDVERVKTALQAAATGDVADCANLEALLVENGHNRGHEFSVLRIERSFTNDGADERSYLARRFELALSRAYCFTYKGELLMLVDVTQHARENEGGFVQELPLVARENLAKVGISRLFTEMNYFGAAIEQARIALEYGIEKSPTNWCHRFEDCAFPWLVQRAAGDIPPERICHPAVTTLLRYDDSHGTDLLHTLSTFMKRRYNATTAANDLFVARSTLIHRLVRIKELTKIDFDDPQDRDYLSLSLAMISLL